jgi:hypothetical protein
MTFEQQVQLSSELEQQLGIHNNTSLTKTIDDNSIVINTNFVDAFSQANLNRLKEIISTDAYPELYGDELPKGIQFIDFDIYDIDVLNDSIKKEYGAQQGRAGENQKFDKIKNDIITNGYKLRYPPIAICVYPDGSIKIITGKTRTKILKNNCKMKNAIVAVYKVTDNRTLITQSVRFNCVDVPTGVANGADVISAGQELINGKMLNKNLADIKGWIYEATGDGPFTEAYKDQLAQTILNNANTRPLIYSWRPENINQWMSDHNYKKAALQYPGAGLGNAELLFVKDDGSEPDILYLVCASSSWTKNIYRASIVMANPHFIGKTLRIIVHTSTLESSNNTKDLQDQYDNRVKLHNFNWKESISNYAETFFVYKNEKGDNVIPKNTSKVVLYATLPAIKKIHNMDELVLL